MNVFKKKCHSYMNDAYDDNHG